MKEPTQSSAMEAALFDLDGVLIDSEGAYTVFWTDTARAHGLPEPEKYALEIKGTALSRILQSFPEEKRESIVASLHEFERHMVYPLYQGAWQFLESLRLRGVKCALVTSSSNDKMALLWQQHPGLQAMFDALVTGNMVTRSKPDPEGYLLAAKMLGVPPEKCVVFEDSLQGLKAGGDAGCKVVAITTGNTVEAVAPLSHLNAPSLSALDLAEVLLLMKKEEGRMNNE